MLKDNQLSTVLLLIALGFLIYYLTKPSSTEGFAEEEKPVEVKEETKPVQNEVRPVEQPAQIKAAAEVQPEVLKQVLAEAEAVAQTNANAKAASANAMDVFNFEGNDTLQSGAELDSAFQRPIPQDAKPDQVDLNKNNVKKYDAKDFLPKEVNDKWFDTDFSQAKYNINDDKLINTERYVIGINTVGQSLKNASYDIRGTIPNPKFSVSPWNNSTYEPDFNLKPLC
jgi:hypothetical protein